MKNYFLFIIIAFLLSLLLIFALVLPKYKDLNLLKEEVFGKEIKLHSQEKYFQRLQQISEELKQNQASFLKIESAIPEDSSLPELLNFFQKAASQSGLTLEGISPALISSGREKVKETSVNLILRGRYSNFKDFLSIVEKSARLIEIENIYFTSPKEGEDIFTFRISTKVHSY